jgi:transposase
MPQVETTAGPMAEAEVTRASPEALQAKQLRPSLHSVETGALDAALLVTSQQEHGVERRGPTRPDDTWQAQAGQGCDASHLTSDGAQAQAICPRGRPRLRWTPAVDRSHQAVSNITFSRRDGQPCASRALGPRAARRTVTVRPQAQHLGLQAARPREQTAAYTAEDAKRAGLEGALSQAMRALGVRRARYRGAANTHLQYVVTAAAIHWLVGSSGRVVRWRSPGQDQAIAIPASHNQIGSSCLNLPAVSKVAKIPV